MFARVAFILRCYHNCYKMSDHLYLSHRIYLLRSDCECCISKVDEGVLKQTIPLHIQAIFWRPVSNMYHSVLNMLVCAVYHLSRCSAFIICHLKWIDTLKWITFRVQRSIITKHSNSLRGLQDKSCLPLPAKLKKNKSRTKWQLHSFKSIKLKI